MIGIVTKLNGNWGVLYKKFVSSPNSLGQYNFSYTVVVANLHPADKLRLRNRAKLVEGLRINIKLEDIQVYEGDSTDPANFKTIARYNGKFIKRTSNQRS